MCLTDCTYATADESNAVYHLVQSGRYAGDVSTQDLVPMGVVVHPSLAAPVRGSPEAVWVLLFDVTGCPGSLEAAKAAAINALLGAPLHLTVGM